MRPVWVVLSFDLILIFCPRAQAHASAGKLIICTNLPLSVTHSKAFICNHPSIKTLENKLKTPQLRNYASSSLSITVCRMRHPPALLAHLTLALIQRVE